MFLDSKLLVRLTRRLYQSKDGPENQTAKQNDIRIAYDLR